MRGKLEKRRQCRLPRLAPGVLLDRRDELDRRRRPRRARWKHQGREHRSRRAVEVTRTVEGPPHARCAASSRRTATCCEFLVAARMRPSPPLAAAHERARQRRDAWFARLVDPKLQARGLAELALGERGEGPRTRPRHRCRDRRWCARSRSDATVTLVDRSPASQKPRRPRNSRPRSRSRNASPAVRRSRRSPPTPEISPTPARRSAVQRTARASLGNSSPARRARISSAASSPRDVIVPLAACDRRGPCRPPRSTRRGTRRRPVQALGQAALIPP